MVLVMGLEWIFVLTIKLEFRVESMRF
uniref:Uncharacterized protein n=1 Tax=Rhizophora mucronata TaxID=61149 RepID=A0A2P2LDP5_RHIMU